MNLTNAALLGGIAGVTIFLGLPIGRLGPRAVGVRSLLNAITIGVLLFLLWDVLTHAVEPVEVALTKAALDHTQTWWPFIGLGSLFLGGIIVGLVGLAAYDSWIGARAKAIDPTITDTGGSILHLHEPASRLAFLIAVGIGLHNFSEGLAIGQSAASGEISLAVVLVVGFALHNATEGFGITAPLAGGSRRPGWGQLALLGLIGGGPTVVGAILGGLFVNDALAITFLALAAGSIIYVIIQLLGVALKLGRGYALYWGILIGLAAGFATDFIVTAAGV
jgi:ZIP family zinc transporter